MPGSCYFHPNLPAVMVCSRCGKPTCYACSKPYLELSLCPHCYHTITPIPGVAPATVPVTPPVTPTAAPMPPPAYGSLPAGGVVYGPFPTRLPFFGRPWASILMVIAAASLIIGNAVALLSPSFFAWWASFVPWVIPLGSFAFILGVVLGLILFGTVILLFLGFRVLAAFVIFPTAIVSFFIGGGFFVGLIFGVLAGLLIIMYKRF